MPTPSLEQAARTLYDGPASAFVSTRKELAAEAKAAGDAPLSREIAALRKPSAAAEAVNHLAPESLQQLLGAGAALRAAQTRLDTDELKRLTSERQRLLHDVVSAMDVSASVRDEVRSTLLAATADPDAEAAVSSRALVRALRYSGWGEVDLSDALAHRAAAERGRAALRVVAAPDSEPDDTSTGRSASDAAASAQRAVAIETAQAEVTRAERRLRAATDAYAAARAARASAQAALDAAQAELEIARGE